LASVGNFFVILGFHFLFCWSSKSSHSHQSSFAQLSVHFKNKHIFLHFHSVIIISTEFTTIPFCYCTPSI
jgi:hypothetical protein